MFNRYKKELDNFIKKDRKNMKYTSYITVYKVYEDNYSEQINIPLEIFIQKLKEKLKEE